MSEGGETVALQLDPTQSFAGHSFALARDGHGGTTVVDPSPTLTTLYYFSGTDGSDPDGGVIVDAAGDLFGTTANGGANGDGTVFELVNGRPGFPPLNPDGSPAQPDHTLQTLIEFNGGNGDLSESGLTADAAGDLFGTTQYGGATLGNGGTGGTVFEITKTGAGFDFGFNGTNGANPWDAPLIADAAGDLFGTSGYTVYEIAKTAGGGYNPPTALTTDGLAGTTRSSLLLDTAGDLFGTTYDGGANGDGTAFELVKMGTGYDSTPTTLVSFNGTNGSNPYGGLIADAAGNLFGETSTGGTYGDGTVFAIAKTSSGYASTPTTIVSFNGTDGKSPIGGLIADAAGDLFGVTEYGGASGEGTVFEIVDRAPRLSHRLRQHADHARQLQLRRRVGDNPNARSDRRRRRRSLRHDARQRD